MGSPLSGSGKVICGTDLNSFSEYRWIQMSDLKSLTAIFAASMSAGSTKLPFRRALRQHLDDVALLHARGYLWEHIAAQMTEHGARHKRGQPICAHQLRTEYGRLIKTRHLSSQPHIKQPDPKMPTAAPTSIKSAPSPVQSRASGPTRLQSLLSARSRPVEFDD